MLHIIAPAHKLKTIIILSDIFFLQCMHTKISIYVYTFFSSLKMQSDQHRTTDHFTEVNSLSLYIHISFTIQINSTQLHKTIFKMAIKNIKFFNLTPFDTK